MTSGAVAGAVAGPFQEAAERGQLLIPVCDTCRRPHWYPRPTCPFCGGEAQWRPASGRGTLYSFSHTARSDPPSVIAFVKLEEGPVMMTAIVAADPQSLRVDQPVHVAFVTSADGVCSPVFQPNGPVEALG